VTSGPASDTSSKRAAAAPQCRDDRVLAQRLGRFRFCELPEAQASRPSSDMRRARIGLTESALCGASGEYQRWGRRRMSRLPRKHVPFGESVHVICV